MKLPQFACKPTAALVAAVFLGLAATGASAQGPLAAAPIDQATIDKGKRLYTSNCARCHGLNMVSTGAGFFDLRTFPPNDKARFVNSVSNGVRAMPAWKESLKPEEIDLLFAYVTAGKR